MQKKPPLGPDESRSSLLPEQTSLDGDTESPATSPSSSSLDTWGSHKLVKAFGRSGAGGHGPIRPARKPGSGTSFSEADSAEDPRATRSMPDGEMRKALAALSHGVSSDGVYGVCVPRARRRFLVSLEDVQGGHRLARPKKTPDPTYSYSAKHPLHQRARAKPAGSPPPRCDLQLLRDKARGGGWAFPPRRMRGRAAVSEFNITYVVERSLHGHLSWSQLVRPVTDRTLSKAERQDLRRRLLDEDGGAADRKWAASVDRCTKRVLLRIQQKSVSLWRRCSSAPFWQSF